MKFTLMGMVMGVASLFLNAESHADSTCDEVYQCSVTFKHRTGYGNGKWIDQTVVAFGKSKYDSICALRTSCISTEDCPYNALMPYCKKI